MTEKAHAENAVFGGAMGPIRGVLCYSPLWLVSIYDNAAFPAVKDLSSAAKAKAKVLAAGAATVKCPIVTVEP